MVHLCWVVLVASSCAPASAPPESVRKLVDSRRQLVSGVVEWTCVDHVRLPGRALRFVSRYARNGDRISNELGDAEGWVHFIPGVPPKPVDKFPRSYLSNAMGRWQTTGTAVRAEWWQPGEIDPNATLTAQGPRGGEFRDIRGLGLYPVAPIFYEHGPNTIFVVTEKGETSWEESHRGDLVEVTAHTASGVTLIWLLDPQRDWNPVSVTARAGTAVTTMENQLERFGKIWFPVRSEILFDGAPRMTWTVETADFCSSDDLKAFTCADIGIEAGFNVIPRNVPPEKTEVLFWNGDALVAKNDWLEAVRSGKRQPGPKIKWKSESGGGDSPYLTPEQRAEREAAQKRFEERDRGMEPLTAWERYVAEFVRRYDLNDEQSQRAQTVLHDCESDAQKVLAPKLAELSRLQADYDAAARNGDTNQQMQKAAAIAEINRPLDRIFESSLKLRLEKIPTSAQRRAAEAHPSSRPATQPVVSAPTRD